METKSILGCEENFEKIKKLFPEGSFIKVEWYGDNCTISKISRWNDAETFICEFGLNCNNVYNTNTLYGIKNSMLSYPTIDEVSNLLKTHEFNTMYGNLSVDEIQDLINELSTLRLVKSILE